MKRKMIAGLLIFAMLFTCVPTMAMADDTHKHPVCGISCVHTGNNAHSEIEFKAWSTADAMPTDAGNYYLTTDVNINTTWEPANNTVLCLNGHILQYTGAEGTAHNDSSSVIKVMDKGKVFTLCDCDTTTIRYGYWETEQYNIVDTKPNNNYNTIIGGIVTGGKGEHNTIHSPGYSNGGAIYVKNGTINLYGGNLAGNKVNNRGGGIYLNEGDSALNMYGGTIIGNAAAYGGGVYVNMGNMNMYDGEISFNKASIIGGGVEIDGHFTMYDGEIIGNLAEGAGGIYVYSSAEIKSGTISNNIATENGGIRVRNEKSLTLSGLVNITGNTNGNVYLNCDLDDNDIEKASVKIADAGLTSGSAIGITLGNDDGKISVSDFGAFTENAAAQYASYFFSDNSDYCVGINTDNTLKLQEHSGGAATCTAKAVCEKCKAEYGDLLPHTEVTDPAVAPTCTTTGLTEGKHCSVCDTVLVEQKTVAMVAHTYGDDNTCDVCGYTKPSAGGGFNGDYNYPVVIADTDGADVKVSEEHAIEGETVTITVTPESGKQVDEVIVTDEDGDVIPVTKVGDNKFTFIMPKGKVSVAVTTKAINYDTKVVLQINNKNVVVNNKTIVNDVAPQLMGDRTLVPIRVIIEALGGSVDWNEATRTVTIIIDGKVLTLVIDEEIPGFGQGATIMDNRTYVPIRYVAEYVGAYVEWIAESQQVVIMK